MRISVNLNSNDFSVGDLVIIKGRKEIGKVLEVMPTAKGTLYIVRILHGLGRSIYWQDEILKDCSSGRVLYID